MKRVSYSFIINLAIIYFMRKLHEAAALLGPQVQRVSLNELPFIASLSAEDDHSSSPAENHFCTGVLISDRTILTADHCTVKLKRERVIIRLGCPALRFCEKHDYETWTSYKTWAAENNRPSDDFNDDIAIIKLKKRVSIRPAIMKSTANGIAHGTKLYMAGWGSLDDGSGPDYLRKVSVKVLPIEECERKSAFLPLFLDWERKICTATDAESGYALVGPGDSGGPLFNKKYQVVGINLGRFPDGEPLNEQVNDHCTIRFYREFIKYFMD